MSFNIHDIKRDSKNNVGGGGGSGKKAKEDSFRIGKSLANAIETTIHVAPI